MVTCRTDLIGGRLRLKTPEDLFEDFNYLDLSKADLSVGDKAFLFSGEVYDFSHGRREITGEKFDLAKRFQQKPVALIFGSYT